MHFTLCTKITEMSGYALVTGKNTTGFEDQMLLEKETDHTTKPNKPQANLMTHFYEVVIVFQR